MKRFKLIGLIIYDNLFTNVILAFIALICSLLIVNVFYVMGAKVTVLDVFEQSHMDEAIIVGPGMGQTSDDLIEELSDCEMVGSVEAFEMITLHDYKNSVTLVTTLFDKSFNKDVELDLEEGRMPQAENEVAIAGYEVIRNADLTISKIRRDIYHIGDILEVTYDTRCYPIHVRVVGILAKDHLELEGIRADDAVVMRWSPDEENGIVAHGYGIDYCLHAVSGTLVKDSGEIVSLRRRNMKAGDSVVVRPAEGVTTDELREFLRKSDYQFASTVLSGPAVKDTYQDSTNEDLQLIGVRFAVISVVLLLCMYSFMFLRIRRCTTELACYYMNGMTWNQSNILFLAAFLPGILFGSVLGIALFPRYALKYQLKNYEYRFDYMALTVLLVLGFAVLVILPMFFDSRRHAVVDIIKQE